MYFCYFVIISPWKKAEPFIWKKNWVLSTLGCFVPSLIEIGPVVLEKKMKMWKVYANNVNGNANDIDNDDDTDDGQRTNCEPSAQVS